MRCSYCDGRDTRVTNSRPTEDDLAVRRRRECQKCGNKFSTRERLHLSYLNVLKRSGRSETFDRGKLLKSLRVALHKRPVGDELVERAVNNIVLGLQGSYGHTVPSTLIGDLAMGELKRLDQVAYVLFASVYLDFREARDFQEFARQAYSTE